MNTIKINTADIKNEISPVLYGIFFEDINYGGDGGLYAELIANRSFSYYDRDGKTDKHKMCWEIVGKTAFEISDKEPLNNVNTHYAHVSGNVGDGISNTGFCGEGFAVKSGEEFELTCYIKSDKPCRMSVMIFDKNGNSYAGENFVTDNKWTKHEILLKTTGSCKNAYIKIIFEEKGCCDIAYVSLFPKNTFCGRRNGMRKDLSEMIKALSPKFMRFPGGCIVEGRSFENMYRWKETIGDVTKRPTNWNRWQMEEYQQCGRSSADYFQSYGIGYFEYFQFCEDIGAKPVPVMNVGMTCQWHEALCADTDKLDPWIEDILDLIEFANGSVDSKWGSVRAKMGHEEPFGLEYIGVGNEQWGKEYFDRYEIFQKKISKKHPEIKLITCAGWDSEGEEFDTAMRWLENNKDKAYAVDEHFYKSPQWFFENISRYDNYDRTLPKVFIGEYAAHTDTDVPKRRNNWLAALSEAAFLTGVENNSDHVIMTCYAPLLARENHQQWQSDMIWFDNEKCYGSPSYYVQKMFSEFVGDRLISSVSDNENIKLTASLRGDNEIVVKLVNVGEEEKVVSFDIDADVAGIEWHTLCAEPDDENSMECPLNVAPQVEKVCGNEYRIQGNSVNVFVMQKK